MNQTESDKIPQKPIKTVKLKIVLDVLRGSVNSMMIPSKGKRKAFIYSGNYREAKKKVKDYLEKNYPELEGYLADHPKYYYTTVKYVAWDNWLTKTSKYQQLRKKDVANFTKNAEDVIFSYLSVDDCSIIESNIQKGMIKPDQTVSLCCDINLYAMNVDILKRGCCDVG